MRPCNICSISGCRILFCKQQTISKNKLDLFWDSTVSDGSKLLYVSSPLRKRNKNRTDESSQLWLFKAVSVFPRESISWRLWCWSRKRRKFLLQIFFECQSHPIENIQNSFSCLEKQMLNHAYNEIFESP